MDDLTLAVTLARAAGSLAADMRANGLDVDSKGHSSEVVTAADRAAENLVVRALSEERPDDGLLGEEGAGRAARSGRTWVIDPVDGTWNFIHHLPTWCAAVSLRDDATGLGLAAAVYQPTTDTVWFAGAGVPTVVSIAKRTEILAPLPRLPLCEVSIATYLHSTTTGPLLETWLRLAHAGATTRVLGSGSMDLAFVAEGRLGVFAQPDVSDWDWLPGSTLVRAAGGTALVVEHGGHRWHLAGPAGAVNEAARVIAGG